MRIGQKQAGDTIIEVMLAFTVFAMLAVGAITLMNQGVASAQESLETTLVRQEIDGQAESLRFIHQAYMTDKANAAARMFEDIRNTNVSTGNPTKFGDAACLNSIPSGDAQSFVIDPRNGTKVEAIKPMRDTNEPFAPVYAKLQYDDAGNLQAPYGLWIEAVVGGDIAASQPGFIDFHIRACWYSARTDVARALGTIVRLYVPA